MHPINKFFLRILISLLPILAFSHEIEVTDGNLKYTLKTDKDFIGYQTEEASLSLTKKPCNAHIIDNFNKSMDRLISNTFLSSIRPGFVQVKIDNVVGYEPRFSERAFFLLSMNKKIKKYKIEEELNCSK